MHCVLLDDSSVCVCGIFSVWTFMYILILLTVGFSKSLETRVSCVLCFQLIWYRALEHVTWIISLLFMTNYSEEWTVSPHKVTLLVLKHGNVRLDKLLRLSDQQAIYSRFIKKIILTLLLRLDFAGSHLIWLRDDILLNTKPHSSLSVLILALSKWIQTYSSLVSCSHDCHSITANLIRGWERISCVPHTNPACNPYIVVVLLPSL